MPFQTRDLLQAIGPSASLVFAAWIFLSFLQSRYVAAFERYRALANDFREGRPGRRQDSLRRQILLYKRRCTWMRWATRVGVVSAMLLICTLLTGAADVVFPGHAVVPVLGAVFSALGLVMVMVAAGAVLIENNLIEQALEEELSDLPEFQPANERTADRPSPPARGSGA